MRILIAEDHALVRWGLSTLLAGRPEHSVVAETSEGLLVEKLVAEHAPDLVLLDLALPDCSGLEVATRLRRSFPALKILILTGSGHPSSISQAFSVGVDGYLLKHENSSELLTALATLEAGQKYMSPVLAASGAGQAMTRKKSLIEEQWELTPREQQILRMIAEGYSNREIAGALNISVFTSRKHRQNLMHKLGLHNSAEITAYAIRCGFQETPSQPS
jgi:DNA-binding NarL/FixJ family response regulator